MSRRERYPEERGRELVYRRAGGSCEGCGHPHGTDWSHRVGRAQLGGWEPSNGMLLCRPCHDWAHRHPALARERGWIVKGSRDPREVPARIKTRRGIRWGLLDDEGGITWALPGTEGAL